MEVRHESIEDTFKDIAVYSTLAMILFRKEQKQAEIMQAMFEEAEKCETKEDIKGLTRHRCYSGIFFKPDQVFLLERKQ